MLLSILLLVFTILFTIVHFFTKKIGLFSLVVSIINFVVLLVKISSMRYMFAFLIFGKSASIFIVLYIAITVICLLFNLFAYMKDSHRF